MPPKPSNKPEKKPSAKKPAAPKKTVKKAAASPSVKKVMDSWERRKLEQKEKIRTLGEEIFDKLVKLGVAKLLVEFDGSGDDGEVAVITVEMVDKKPAPVLDYKHPLYFGIEDLVCTHLALDHPGWELEAGSFGSYELDVANRKAQEKEFTLNDEDEENREKIRTLGGEIFDKLAKLGVIKLLAKFGGDGDPYALTAVNAEMTGKKPAPVFDSEHPLYYDIEELVQTQLNLDHPDGVDDDSFGSYEFDVARRQMKAKEFTLNDGDEED